MISGYHEQVAQHYEAYPYPQYPWFAWGRWKQLESVNISRWGADFNPRSCWIVGCGTISPLMFGRRNPNVEFLATDLSRESLKLLRRRLWVFGIHNIRLRCEDLMESPYQENFDAIDCYGVLHHTFSPQLSLEKLTRALRPGGVLRLMIYNREARQEIESLRHQIIEQGTNSIESIQNFIKGQKVKPSGDLSNKAGLADAFLNPIIHTFSRENALDLIRTQPQLEILTWSEKSNYVFFLRKKP